MRPGRRPPFRWTDDLDLAVMREVTEQRPFDAPWGQTDATWRSVLLALQRGNEAAFAELTQPALRTRFGQLKLNRAAQLDDEANTGNAGVPRTELVELLDAIILEEREAANQRARNEAAQDAEEVREEEALRMAVRMEVRRRGGDSDDGSDDEPEAEAQGGPAREALPDRRRRRVRAADAAQTMAEFMRQELQERTRAFREETQLRREELALQREQLALQRERDAALVQALTGIIRMVVPQRPMMAEQERRVQEPDDWEGQDDEEGRY